MKGTMKKRASRGDTLVEALVGVLIVSLVTATLAAMVMTASKMNSKVHDHDTELTETLKNVEKAVSGVKGEVKVTIDQGGSKKTIVIGDIPYFSETSGGKTLTRYTMKG